MNFRGNSKVTQMRRGVIIPTTSIARFLESKTSAGNSDQSDILEYNNIMYILSKDYSLDSTN